MLNSELAEILQAFAVESVELLSEMESALLALEISIADTDEFSRLFRAVHTIKGSASIVGHEPVEQFCHNIEHILVRIRERELTLDHILISLLLTCHDHIRSMLEQLSSKNSEQPAKFPDAHLTLLDRLAAWKEAPVVADSTTQIPYGILDQDYLDPVTEPTYPRFGFFEESFACRTPDGTSTATESAAVLPGLLPTKSSSEQNQRVIRVDAAKLDQLSNLIIELVTASSVLEAQVKRFEDITTIESTAHVTNLIKQIQERAMVFRMVPVQTLFVRFQRIVHDSGKANNKDIRLMISGGETELDKAVVEKIYDPLLHLIRNAIDHGIEPEHERVAMGKPASGIIHLQASQDSNSIIIRISDDGNGINMERIAQKAVAQGLLKRDVTATERDLLNCIFEPGFSTLDDATSLSGRGVGMDVVKRTIESLRGRIDIETEKGTGTTFKISIPLSLSLVDGFMVTLGDGLYIIPMELVLETLELPDISVPGVMANGCLQLREHPLPCLHLKKLLKQSGETPSVSHVVVVSHEGKRVGLIVDQLLGEIKAVIKPLGPLFRHVTCVSGASILGDGNIALFLETDRLISSSVTT